MKVYKGLKNIIQTGKLPVQGGIMYSLVMRWLTRMSKPNWQNIIDKQIKRK